MKTYDSYKKSGIDWIDVIPSHWTDIAIKYTVSNQPTEFIDGDWIESNVITDYGIRYLTTGNVGALKYKEQGNGFISENTFEKLNCTEVFPGDLLISRLNEPIARTCIVPDLGYRIVVAVDNVIYRPKKELYDKRYIMYQMNCIPYSEKASFMARGSTMHRISRSMLGGIKLCIPSLDEQAAIANYLDNKCSKIDNVIATQEKRVELFRELKQSIITRAVTRGLNPDAKMKDSGVKWIGQIPSHWQYAPLKRFAQVILGKMLQSYSQDESDSLEDYICAKDVHFDGVDLSDLKQMYFSKSDKELYLVKKGDMLIVEGGAGAGGCSIVKADIQNVYIQNSIMIIRGNECLDNRFVCHFFSSIASRGYVEMVTNVATIPHFSKEKVQSTIIPIPPIEEQKQIADYIDQKILLIDGNISNSLRKIELLKQYKQSLITEVVTGKRKVC